MKRTEVLIKKLMEEAVLPKYGTEFSAGADLTYCGKENVEIGPGETTFIHTGLSVEIPVGYAGMVFARSGLASKRGLAPANKVGVIDSDYRGEVLVALHNHSNTVQAVEPGERIAQLVVMPYLACDFVEADELSNTERGNGGFGSTGKK